MVTTRSIEMFGDARSGTLGPSQAIPYPSLSGRGLYGVEFAEWMFLPFFRCRRGILVRSLCTQRGLRFAVARGEPQPGFAAITDCRHRLRW
jgi:hypothetical protein